MNASDDKIIDRNAWRSFALLGAGLLALVVAGWNLASSEGGSGAFFWVLAAFVFLLLTLAAGLVIDWRRLDWLSRTVQVFALALGVVMIGAVWWLFPDALRMMWHS